MKGDINESVPLLANMMSFVIYSYCPKKNYTVHTINNWNKLTEIHATNQILKKKRVQKSLDMKFNLLFPHYHQFENS